MEEIEQILKEVNDNLDNPEWLSESVVKLASQLYYHNGLMAEAELEEKKAFVKVTDPANGKPPSVERAKAISVSDTQNKYGKLKSQGEALVEVINAVKSRLRVLGWEKENQGKQEL